MTVSMDFLAAGPPLSADWRSRLEVFVLRLLEEYDQGRGEVNIVIADDRYLHQLNRQYRHQDKPTDVLSFSYLDEEPPGGDQPYPLGDIFISADRVLEQAARVGHSAERELAALVIHGLLHLCGFSHDDDEAAAQMEALEKEQLEIFYAEEKKGPAERKLADSFIFAFQGLRYCLETQRNMVIHLIMGTIAFAAGLALEVTPPGLLFIGVAITLVLVAEAFNTALEASIDLFCRECAPQARVAKDAAAGAVLLAALFALLTGAVILGPPLWNLLRRAWGTG